MPAKAKKLEPRQSREEQVTRWRFDQLLKLGLAPDQAVGLIEQADVVHKAEALKAKGCSPGLIAYLLEV